MSLTYSSKGTPVIDVGEYKISLVNMDKTKDKWKWVSVKSGNKSEVVPLDLKALKTSIMPMKVRNQVKKVLSKYVKDGYIHKDDVQSLHDDLKPLLGESTVKRINLIMGV